MMDLLTRIEASLEFMDDGGPIGDRVDFANLREVLEGSREALLKLDAAIDQLAERDADLSLARHDYATLLERWREEQQHVLHWRTRTESAESRLDQFCKLAYDISGQQHRDERYWCVWPDQMRKLDDLRREHRGEETARIVETPVNQRGDSGANKS